MFGLGGGILAEKFGSGKFNEMVIAIHNVRGTSEFNGGKTVTNGESDFFGEKTGMRRDNASADDAVSFVGDELDETVVEIVSFAGDDFVEIYYNFFIFAITTNEIILSKTDNGNFGCSVGDTGKTAVVSRSLGAGNEIRG